MNAPMIYPGLAATNPSSQRFFFLQGKWAFAIYLLFSAMLFVVATAVKITDDDCYKSLDPETAMVMNCYSKGLTGTSSFLISCVLFSCVLHRGPKQQADTDIDFVIF